MSASVAKRAAAAYRATRMEEAPNPSLYLSRVIPKFQPACIFMRDLRNSRMAAIDLAIIVVDRPPARFSWKIEGVAANLHVFPKPALEKLLRQGISNRLRSLICSGDIVFGDLAIGQELQSLARMGSEIQRPILSPSRISEKRVLIEELRRDMTAALTIL